MRRRSHLLFFICRCSVACLDFFELHRRLLLGNLALLDGVQVVAQALRLVAAKLPRRNVGVEQLVNLFQVAALLFETHRC